MKKTVLILVALLATMLMILPTWAFVNVDNETYDPKFEMYGPHIDRIFVKMYAGTDPSWNALIAGLVDVHDWPFTKTYYDLITPDPNIAALDYPKEPTERGYFEVTFNENNETSLGGGALGPDDPNPKKPNPTANVYFRRACAYLINKTYLGDVVTEGMAPLMYTEIVPYMVGWLHTGIAPGGDLEELTYPYDEATAIDLLENNGFPLNTTTGWRWPDFDEDGVQDPNEKWDNNNELDLYLRLDAWRNGAGLHLGTNLETIAKVPIEFIPCAGGYAYQKCMIEKDYHMYTGGWIFMGPEPDYLYDLHHPDMYWHSHESAPLNYQRINDTAFNTYLEGVKYNTILHDPNFKYPDYPSEPFIDVNSSCWRAQEIQTDMMHDYPLFSTKGTKGVWKTYSDPGKEYTGEKWKGVANEQGFGLNSWWTFLNAYPECHYYAVNDTHPMVMQYAWKEIGYPEHLNILYAEWYWDFEVLGKVYDALCVRNPYFPAQYIPWLINYYESGTYMYKGRECSKVLISLKTGIKFNDGTEMTANDVAFTLVEASKLLISKGWSPPWWYSSTYHILSYTILDPLTIEILMDTPTSWAQLWALIAPPIIPEHIVRPQIEKWDPTGFYLNSTRADKGLVGTGPFKFVSMVPDVTLEMEANKDFHRYCPVLTEFNVSWYSKYEGGDAPRIDYWTTSYPHVKVDPGYPDTEEWVNIRVGITNLWMNGCSGGELVIDKFVYLDGSPIDTVTDLTIYSNADGTFDTHIEEYNLLLQKCMHTFEVKVHVKGPEYLDATHKNPWVCQWINTTLPIWVTIKYDIAGAKYLGKVVAPDCKVEGKDNAFVAAAYNTVPGDPRWKANADVTGDYKIEGKDVAWIAKYYGKW